MVSPEIWKEAKKKESEILSFSKDSLLNSMLKQAEEALFNFDKLLTLLNDPIDVKRAERIFFQKKYRIDLNNNLEEVLLEDPLADFNACLSEMKKEKRKEDLIRLTEDLKTAEEKKDKEAINFLRQEFDRVSKESKEIEG